MNDAIEFVKAIVRPYLIMSTWTVILIMNLYGEEVPAFLMGIGSAIAAEYFAERAVKRVREEKNK